MLSRTLCLLFLATNLNASVALAQDRIYVSITNEYQAKVDFGALGQTSRDGTDRAEGVLERQGDKYVGILGAVVVSTQHVTGLGGVGNCGPSRFEDSQKLRVIGHSEVGFNTLVQSVDPATMTGQASNNYLRLEFIPDTMPTLQPDIRLPEDMHPDLVVACHTFIDTLSGIAFLPLNDSRWTMEGGGYIIQLPSSGKIVYTDTTVAGPAQLGPFTANRSVWTIEVERLP